MKTTIDSAGRIVIPRVIRHAIGLEPGAVVDVEARGGSISIEPAAASVKIVRRGRLRVAVLPDVKPLSEEAVRAVRDDLRGRR
ncbi:MAG TPA: AbrB/MazE/SpoVT family DNA-binding domain-containing protein [Thermoanaerobaculia bacterium]